MHASAIRQLTKRTRPPLVPEIELWLATPGSPLWDPTPEQLELLGCPHPFWAFAWGGGQALARHLLDHPTDVRGRRVLSLGCGAGTEAVAAALCGASRVLATDIDAWALSATRLNASLNGVLVDTALLDVTNVDLQGWDCVLAAEVTYDRDSTDALLSRLEDLDPERQSLYVADLDRGFFPAERFRRVGSYRAPSDIDIGGRYHKHATVLRRP